VIAPRVEKEHLQIACQVLSLFPHGIQLSFVFSFFIFDSFPIDCT
jgi:hypothetical protein